MRVWLICCICLMILVTVVNVLSLTVFYSLFNIVMPGSGRTAIYAEGVEPVYVSDYESKEKTLLAANELNTEICREGFILLKNKNFALPVKTQVSDPSFKDSVKVSVFGKNSVNLSYGGSGSGGAMGGEQKTLYDSLEAAGYETNDVLRSFYEDDSRSGDKRNSNSSDLDSGNAVFLSTAETPQAAYTSEVKASYADYKDMALVVFTRIGGEGFDLPRNMKGMEGAGSDDDHYLQLDANEIALLSEVCNYGFGKVVVIINSASAMELGFLERPEYFAYCDKIDAALNIGFPGNSGIMALGEILNGTVNPSGKTVDTYSADFKKDPTWNNFGDNNILPTYESLTGKQLSRSGDQYVEKDNKKNPFPLYYFVDYEEGVYVGYRYYETRGVTDGEEWYKNNVIYPFGFGLSYTQFEWELVDDNIRDVAIGKDEEYFVKIKVTNTGNVAGKETVQLFGHSPYINGEIEKPEEILLDFAKTPLLYPEDEADGDEKPNSCIVELKFTPYSLASYDYKDANGNGFCGYELDAGDYALYISADAHNKRFTLPFSVSGNIRYEYSTVEGNEDVQVKNLYTDCENAYFNSDTQLSTVLSRSDWENTWPTSPTEESWNVDADFIKALQDVTTNNPENYSDEDMPFFDVEGDLTLRDMITDANGEYAAADYDDPRWDALISQCSLKELISMCNNGAFQSLEIDMIKKPLVNDADGPAGFVNFMPGGDKTYYGTCYYCCETVMGATYNQKLIEEFGRMVGNEGIWGDINGTGNGLPYSGWYAPGVNIHRSPFGGRNFEYFSEDGVLNGKMAAAQIKGCRSKGVYCFIKHFALNEQETHRSVGGNCSWVTEQAMREIYLKPFELAVKEGRTTAVMSSFNRIGTRWTGGDWRLLTQILRNEWGFEGMVICDFNTVPQYMNSRQMAYAGGDLNLTLFPESWCDESDVADVMVLKKNVKNILYTVANSNAMNGEIVGYRLPVWVITFICFDVAVAAGLAVWGFFTVKRSLKKSRNEK